ncbi:LysR substrate-binding domain-containing protein [uncultured Tateyamaria sp.]|uniref:LysR substrate-binding domain-containing protein n=1 Tax=uncultured Tateyamaria sp. TaxID=455651 RepID=UPI00262CE4DC|nr:LysR substrate-binding domain-containing protein [uncultured Tateyamaria sp.]
MPPLRALSVFAVLAASDRHKDAAKSLGVTTSAVSQQIRILEDWFGTALFDRNVRTPVLTPTGRTLFQTVEPPLTRISAYCRAMRRAARDTSLVVSAPAAFLSHRLIPHLGSFWDAHPGIEVDVRVAASYDAPVDLHDVDVAIRFCDTPVPGRAIGRSGWSAFCRPDTYEALGRPTSVADLEDATLLHEAIYNFWPQEFALAGLDVPSGISFRGVGDANLVLSAVLAGNAVALLPTELAWQFARQGALVSLFRAAIEPEASYVAIYDRDVPGVSINKLIDHIENEGL